MKKYVSILFALSVWLAFRESWGVTISLQLAEENASFQFPVLISHPAKNIEQLFLHWLEKEQIFNLPVKNFVPNFIEKRTTLHLYDCDYGDPGIHRTLGWKETPEVHVLWHYLGWIADPEGSSQIKIFWETLDEKGQTAATSCLVDAPLLEKKRLCSYSEPLGNIVFPWRNKLFRSPVDRPFVQSSVPLYLHPLQECELIEWEGKKLARIQGKEFDWDVSFDFDDRNSEDEGCPDEERTECKTSCPSLLEPCFSIGGKEYASKEVAEIVCSLTPRKSLKDLHDEKVAAAYENFGTQKLH